MYQIVDEPEDVPEDPQPQVLCGFKLALPNCCFGLYSTRKGTQCIGLWQLAVPFLILFRSLLLYNFWNTILVVFPIICFFFALRLI